LRTHFSQILGQVGVFSSLNGCGNCRFGGLGARARGGRRGSFLWCGLGLLGWSQNGVQGGSFHAWHELHQAGVADIQNEAINNLIAQIAMRHLTAFEAQGGLDLVALSQETNRLILLGLVVVLVDGHGEFDLFDDDDLLFLAGSAIALVLLIEELSVVLNLADRRNGVGGDLYQVERSLASHLEGIKGSHDAELFAIFVDDANLAGADAFVGADKRLGGTFINRWNKSPPQRISQPLCVV